MTVPANDPGAFLRENTRLDHAPLVPEIVLFLASEITPIWLASEDWLREKNIEPPFWAFAWPGGQALARHILDHPEIVAGKRVLDFAAGGGIAAIACAMAGAASVEAAEIDPLAVAAINLNARQNGVNVTALSEEGPIRLRPDDTAGETAADSHHCHRLCRRDPRSLVELLIQGDLLFGRHRRHPVEDCSHQKPPLSLPVEADSTLPNNSSNTPPTESNAGYSSLSRRLCASSSRGSSISAT